MLDTDQLRSFIAIVDTGSFTRAANRVNKSQSAVSMQIRRLEERLDATLFVKHGRGARLSPEGERLVEHARSILQAQAAALAELAVAAPQERVVFGIPDDYAGAFLRDFVGRLTSKHPQIELSVCCHNTKELAERVHAGEIDVALVTQCAGLTGIEVLREELLHWVVGLRAGPIAEGRPLPLALSTPTCPGRQQALAALDAAGIPSRLFLTSSNYAAIAPVVEGGLAVTVLPDALVDSSTQRVLGADSGLPPLAPVRYGLLRGSSQPSKAAVALGEAVRASLASRLSWSST